MSRKLTILAVAINAVGHVEAVRGALSGLLQRGHRIIFMLDESFHGKLSPHGFEEHLYRSGNNESNLEQAPSTENPGESMARWLFDSHIIGDYPPEEKLSRLNGLLHCEDNYRDTAFRDGQIKEAIARYTPDCIYFDGISLHPAIYYSSITLIHNISVVPNYFVFHKDVPPAESG